MLGVELSAPSFLFFLIDTKPTQWSEMVFQFGAFGVKVPVR